MFPFGVFLLSASRNSSSGKLQPSENMAPLPGAGDPVVEENEMGL